MIAESYVRAGLSKTFWRTVSLLGVTLLWPCLPASRVEAQEKTESKYKDAREAYNVGAAYYTTKNYKDSRDAFEAAVKLSDDDKFKVRTYRALTAVYRNLPENDGMFTAAEFIVAKSESDAERSLTRRALLSFIYERGLVDQAVERYEKTLKDQPQDRTVLYILSEIYVRLSENPKRSTERIERLTEIDKKNSEGKPIDVGQSSSLAGEYVKAKKFKEAAELYEKIAPLNQDLAAWHWKDAAAAWLKADDRPKALAAAKKAHESPPEKRNQLLTHFWHQGLADVFLQLDEPQLAIPHYELAIENTNIDGYKKSCQKKLEEARAKAKGGN